MKYTLLIMATLATAPSYAMLKKADSELHVAAKEGNYAKCYALLTRMPFEKMQMPPAELFASVSDSFKSSTPETAMESEPVKQVSKHLYEQSEAMNQARIKMALILRTAINAEGLIPRECCDYRDEKLCKLLDPSINDFFTLDRNPAFQQGQPINLFGRNYVCTEAKKLYTPPGE